MGKSAWSPSGEFPPLPLLDGDTVVDQPVNLDTLSVRYAQRAGSFIKNASASAEPWLLYLAFQVSRCHGLVPHLVSPTSNPPLSLSLSTLYHLPSTIYHLPSTSHSKCTDLAAVHREWK